jgi:HEAT repeat protein
VTPPCALTWDHPFILGQGQEAGDLARVTRQTIVERSRARAFPPPFDELSASAATDVADRWSEPCEAAFEFLAQNYPHELLKLIASDRLRPTDLTFAAEIAGQLLDSSEARGILRPLLDHGDAVVREGAIYGLARHVDQAVRTELSRLVTSDLSPAVRQAAADTLENL